jgi:hypothetical protein
MASGTLGQASLAANTNTTVYTVPGATTATVNISVVNTNSATPVSFELAVAATSTPAASEYLLKSLVLDPQQSFEKTGVVISTGKLVVVRSTAANVSVNVYGYEA